MTRPASHREQNTARRCGNCCWSAFHQTRRELYCVHGEDERLVIQAKLEQYCEMMLSRRVGESDVCDEWES